MFVFQKKNVISIVSLIFGKNSPNFRYHKKVEKTGKQLKNKKPRSRTTPVCYYVVKTRNFFFSTHFPLTLFWAFEHYNHFCHSLSRFFCVSTLAVVAAERCESFYPKTQSPGVFPAKLLGIEHVRNGFICHCFLAFLFWFLPLINGFVFRL